MLQLFLFITSLLFLCAGILFIFIGLIRSIQVSWKVMIPVAAFVLMCIMFRTSPLEMMRQLSPEAAETAEYQKLQEVAQYNAALDEQEMAFLQYLDETGTFEVTGERRFVEDFKK